MTLRTECIVAALQVDYLSRDTHSSQISTETERPAFTSAGEDCFLLDKISAGLYGHRGKVIPVHKQI